ncbi:MAG: hypothetical protein WC979_01120 [Candidatus Pacearchaeota archaeon]|jgi:hypothetical protein|nr:hypothetical protein [Clostridia bacterium]
MHILDFLMYFVTSGIIWFILDIISHSDLTHEIGGIFGMLVEFIWLIVYIVVFVVFNNNWIDIFHAIPRIFAFFTL